MKTRAARVRVSGCIIMITSIRTIMNTGMLMITTTAIATLTVMTIHTITTTRHNHVSRPRR